ncbi:MAG: head GIN domain-containing protein [Chitinophagaceae bacterium]
MKKLFLSVLILSASASFCVAQKTIQDLNVEKRTVGSFHGITVATGVELVLTQGNVEEVAVSASKTEYRDHIITEVVDGVLKIHYETKTGAINRKGEDKNLKAYVSCKTLDKLNVETGATVEIDGVLSSANLDLKANTGGIVNGKINITTLKVDQSTGSKITLTGTADNVDVAGNTGSKFMSEELKTVQCSANVNTGAKIFITVEKELNVKANTGGEVKYKGGAGIRDVKTRTGGSVSKI